MCDCEEADILAKELAKEKARKRRALLKKYCSSTQTDEEEFDWGPYLKVGAVLSLVLLTLVYKNLDAIKRYIYGPVCRVKRPCPEPESQSCYPSTQPDPPVPPSEPPKSHCLCKPPCEPPQQVTKSPCDPKPPIIPKPPSIPEPPSIPPPSDCPKPPSNPPKRPSCRRRVSDVALQHAKEECQVKDIHCTLL